MMVRFKHRTQNELLIWTLFFGGFLIAPLMQFAKFPNAIKYFLDMAWLLLLITMLFRKKSFLDGSVIFLRRYILGFFVITVVNYIAHFQSPLYYLWGFRNNFRGYVLFFATIYYFDADDVEDVLRVLDKLFYINAAVMLVQFFALGYKQDNLGGIFGVESGCNGYTNIFFCIMTVINYIRYCEKRQRFWKTAGNIVLMLILAAMAEIKFYYVEFIILMMLGTLITRFSWKKFCIIFVGIAAVIAGYNIFVLIFPYIDMSIDGLIQYASSKKGYTSSGDLNRLGFFPVVNQKLLPTLREQIFGLGLGNCDYATGKAFLTTPFFLKYGWMHYQWMSTTFMYLENGLIGLFLFFGFFILVFICSIRMKKTANISFCQISALCAVVAMINAVYNSSLRVESGYMMYFMLAIPWCSVLDIKKEIGRYKTVCLYQTG